MDKETEAQRSQYLAQVPIDNKWQNRDLNLHSLDLDFVNQCMTLERDLSHSGWGAEDEMVRSHHWLNGPEFERTQEIVEKRWAWHAMLHGISKSQTV